MKLPIEQRKIEELARQARHCNVFPLYLHFPYHSDDLKHPVTKLLREIVPEICEYLSILSDEEFEQFLDEIPSIYRIPLERRPERETVQQRERIAFCYLGWQVRSIYLSFSDVVAASLDNSEVLKVYPELRDSFDDDGLLRIDSRFELHDGGIRYKDHFLHYHQFLRRDYGSNPNYDFLGPFARLYSQTNETNDFRIAIDHLRLMPLNAYHRLVELDAWYGPGFDREKLDDRNAVGVTVVKRNPNSLFQLSNKLDRTEFFWSFRDGIKTLQVEEISELDYAFDQYRLNRYLHAERDTERQILRHVDGAVKVYIDTEYPERFTSRLPDEPRSYRKIKLWRIDGDLDVEVWLILTALFFKSNEMIIEYFDPKTFEEVFEERVRDFKAWKAKQEAPA